MDVQWLEALICRESPLQLPLLGRCLKQRIRHNHCKMRQCLTGFQGTERYSLRCTCHCGFQPLSLLLNVFFFRCGKFFFKDPLPLQNQLMESCKMFYLDLYKAMAFKWFVVKHTHSQNYSCKTLGICFSIFHLFSTFIWEGNSLSPRQCPKKWETDEMNKRIVCAHLWIYTPMQLARL